MCLSCRRYCVDCAPNSRDTVCGAVIWFVLRPDRLLLLMRPTLANSHCRELTFAAAPASPPNADRSAPLDSKPTSKHSASISSLKRLHSLSFQWLLLSKFLHQIFVITNWGVSSLIQSIQIKINLKWKKRLRIIMLTKGNHKQNPEYHNN